MYKIEINLLSILQKYPWINCCLVTVPYWSSWDMIYDRNDDGGVVGDDDDDDDDVVNGGGYD